MAFTCLTHDISAVILSNEADVSNTDHLVRTKLLSFKFNCINSFKYFQLKRHYEMSDLILKLNFALNIKVFL